ncbi:hypothetical protein KY328_00265 [Candidatus Woesearchaeota archaeon]|nr:hypothetical protein [Candidatus Woesearchaeota archaeon]
MPNSWEEIKEVVERIEYERLLDELSSLEHEEKSIEKQTLLNEKAISYLEFLGELTVGVTVGIFIVIFNFLLFNWLLHIEF